MRKPCAVSWQLPAFHSFALTGWCYRKSNFVSMRNVQTPTFPTLVLVFRPRVECQMVGIAPSMADTRLRPIQARATKKDGKKRGKSSRMKPLVVQRSGMNAPVVLSEELQEFTGKEMMCRGEILAKLCQYVKENDLYVPGRRQFFICDTFLKNLLKTKGEYRLLQLNSLVRIHLTSPSALGKEYEEKADILFQKQLEERGAVSSSVARVRDPRGMNSLKAQRELYAKGLGMYAETELSPSIRVICGGKEKMPRPDVLKSVWNYIKSNGLQDPKDKRNIIIDDMLGKALQISDRKSMNCFEITKYIWKQTGRQIRSAKQ